MQSPILPTPLLRGFRLPFLAGVACLIMTGCTETAPPARHVVDIGDVAVPSHEAFSPVELTSQPFSTDTALGQPGTLVMHDGLLWVVDYGGAPMLHAFEPKTGTLVWSGGQSGEGPGEFDFISSLGGSAPGGRLWAFDDNPRRFTVIDTNQTNTTPPEVAVLQAEGRLSRAIPIRDDAFFALQMVPPDSAHAVIIDRSGAIVRTEQWPLLGADSVPIYPRMLASGGSFGVALCARPEGDKLAVAYTGAGKIDFFDAQAKHVGEADVPFPTDAVFMRDQSGELRARRPRMWYRGCTANNRYLYALFSGRRDADYEPPDGSAAEYIHVFHWDGTLVRVFHVDRLLANIGISEDDKTLFAVPLGEASIVKYAMPE